MTLLLVLTLVEAATFGLAAFLHLGLTSIEPVIIPAAVVESLAGAGLAVSAYGLFTRRAWAQPVTLGAYAFAIGGVLLGMGALAAGRGPRTDFNEVYHRVILSALLAGVLLQIWLQRSRVRGETQAGSGPGDADGFVEAHRV